MGRIITKLEAIPPKKTLGRDPAGIRILKVRSTFGTQFLLYLPGKFQWRDREECKIFMTIKKFA